jgi:hypothetical protein
MPMNDPASRSGSDVSPADADPTRRRTDIAPLVGWDRVDRRRVVASLAVAPELTALRGGSASPEGVLGSALVHALRQIVRGELEERLAPAASVQPSRWMTPPAASRVTRVPVKTIRAWARDGRIPKRLKNRSADPKQQKYLVNVGDVVAAAERVSAAVDAAAGEPLNVQERARHILAARAAKGR